MRGVPALGLFIGSGVVWCAALIAGEAVAFEIIHDAAYCQPTSWTNSAGAVAIAVVIIAAAVAATVAYKRQPDSWSMHLASALFVGLCAIGTLGSVFAALLIGDTYVDLTHGLTLFDVLFTWLWIPSAASAVAALATRIRRRARVKMPLVQLAALLVPAACLGTWAAVETVARCS